MRKLWITVFPQSILILFLIASFIVVGSIHTAKASEQQTVEGVWEQISANSPAFETLNGKRRTITKTADGYTVTSADNTRLITYSGSPTRIVHTDLEDLVTDDEVHGAGSVIPQKVKQQAPRQKVPLNITYTLSADGNYINREEDAKWLHWDENRNYTNYEIKEAFYKSIFRRISGPSKAEAASEHAYQADCGVVDPNRTEPFPPDHEFCPGNVVAMTYFCGGGTGCPYVCCPKGLPYLNHCDCKCYATSDFDCHSYSYCREKLLK